MPLLASLGGYIHRQGRDMHNSLSFSALLIPGKKHRVVYLEQAKKLNVLKPFVPHIKDKLLD